MRRSIALLVGLLPALVPATAAAPVPAGNAGDFRPTLTVRAAPLEQILGDVRYTADLIARLAPSDKEAKEFAEGTDEFLKKTLGPDWQKGVDTSRPSFGYATIDEKLGTSSGVLMVPVKDATAFLGIAKRLAGKTTPGPDGVTQFDVPSTSGAASKGYVRVFNRYAYVTLNDHALLLPSRIPGPDQFGETEPAALASARLFLDRVPESIRQQVIVGVQQLRRVLDGGPQSSEPVWGIAFTKVFLLGSPAFQLLPFAEPAIRDGQELTLNLRYERKHLDLQSELQVLPKPNSDLRSLVASLKPSTSFFPQLVGPDMAGRGILRSTLPDAVRNQLATQLQSASTFLPQADVVWGKFAARIVESLIPTVREGEFDLALGLAGPGKDERYGAVAGLRIKDGGGVDKAFREAVKALPQNDQAQFKLDVATAAGVKVHQVPSLPALLKPFVGDPAMHVAISQDRVIVALGDGGKALLEKGLHATPQSLTHCFVEVSAAKLVPLVTKIDADAGKKYKAFLGTEIDRVPLLAISVEGGTTLRVRYGNLLAGLAPVTLLLGRAVAAPAP
jgi:hypothetical protein